MRIHSRALFRGWAGGLLVGLLFVLPASHGAFADTVKSQQTKSRAGKATFVEAPSGESRAAREKRLRRECKGRPNAGACLGFTQ